MGCTVRHTTGYLPQLPAQQPSSPAAQKPSSARRPSEIARRSPVSLPSVESPLAHHQARDWCPRAALLPYLWVSLAAPTSSKKRAERFKCAREVLSSRLGPRDLPSLLVPTWSVCATSTPERLYLAVLREPPQCAPAHTKRRLGAGTPGSVGLQAAPRKKEKRGPGVVMVSSSSLQFAPRLLETEAVPCQECQHDGLNLPPHPLHPLDPPTSTTSSGRQASSVWPVGTTTASR
jgi:hypothetical protein